jgi:hypothetical protein
MTRRFHRLALVSLAAATVFALSGCGTGSDTTAADRDAGQRPAATPSATSPSTAPRPTPPRPSGPAARHRVPPPRP